MKLSFGSQYNEFTFVFDVHNHVMTLDQDYMNKLNAMIDKGRSEKIPAIKDLRAKTGLSLKDAKDAIEAYYEFRTPRPVAKFRVSVVCTNGAILGSAADAHPYNQEHDFDRMFEMFPPHVDIEYRGTVKEFRFYINDVLVEVRKRSPVHVSTGYVVPVLE